MPQSTDEDLLRRASECPELPTLEECVPESLREISLRHGTDFATALLYERVRDSSTHGPFIRRLEDLAGIDEPPPRLDATIVIVPGAFHRKFPQSGADGRIVRRNSSGLGCRVETIPLPDFGSLTDNAQGITDWLLEHDHAPILLFSVSKGSSDVKCALSRPDAQHAFRNVVLWFNLGGSLDGAPIVSWLFSDTLRSRWTRFLLRRHCPDLRIVHELERRPDSPLARETRLPPHLQVVHLVGFPLDRHVVNRLSRRNHARVRPYGPNDGGGVLLADTVRWPGLLYPVWGADHYLRPTGLDIDRITMALFRYAAQELASGVLR